MATTSPVRIIIELPDARCVASVGAMEEVADAAERLGFYGLAVGDHLITDGKIGVCRGHHDGDDRVFYEPMQVLAYMAARTETLKLLTSVLVLPNRHPVLLAKQVATLDNLSNGRVILGLGSGALPARKADAGFNLAALGGVAKLEYEAYGVTTHRGKLTDEYTAVMQNMWADEPATFRGATISYSGLEVYPKPIQKPGPPIWWGGRSDIAQKRVVNAGDGWLPSQCPVDIFASGVENIRTLAAEAGRTDDLDFGVSLWSSVDETDEAALAAAELALGPKFRDAQALREGTFIGSPDTFIERIKEYQQVGLNVAVLRCIPPTAEHLIRQMELLARDALPEFA
ncbi:LLM class flavin-dependent oxidoreductase [Conexibacter woesei]|uniref:Luciferase-like, subgroup n=1 Tax=Conexibacter woesei (strain DSM 14684 / CCUG 47730 / CIP 108061 / JCM 11494 / NBRC 100937 / ID131577) TaxID=469383 RepID=D3F0S0_CONWI|nr:TIGR03619 family F420-dependent LLM class oxidoreductase [Conexibacter woesei]ADB54004.1 Luciferase-like, subgroup [Conexibacter woesei DSM 14684]